MTIVSATEETFGPWGPYRGPKTVDEHRRYWEGNFPSRGHQITEMLLPFLDWEFCLAPASPELEKRVAQAVYWREVKTVKLVGPRESSAMHVEDHVGVVRWDNFADEVWQLVGEDVSISESAPMTLWGMLLTQVGYLLEGKVAEAERLRPFLELYLAGWKPLGFDQEGNFLVAVANLVRSS